MKIRYQSSGPPFGFGTFVEVEVETTTDLPVPIYHRVWPDGSHTHCCGSAWLQRVVEL